MLIYLIPCVAPCQLGEVLGSLAVEHPPRPRCPIEQLRSLEAIEFSVHFRRTLVNGPCHVNEFGYGLSRKGSATAGKAHLSATDYVFNTILWPRLAPLTRTYPDIDIDLSITD